MFKAVIFDMDGVIIDSEPIHFRVVKGFTNDIRFDITFRDWQELIGNKQKIIWTRLKEKHRLSQEVDDLVNEHRRRYMLEIETLTNEKPIEGVDILIKDLYTKCIKVALASSSPRNHIEAIIKKFNLTDYFQVMVCGEDVKEGKPSPDIFLHTAKIINTLPDECIVIEDSYNGVLAAKAANMKCIGFRNPNSGNQDLSKADKIVTSLKDINIATLSEL